MSRILIAGCGYVGSALARILVERDRAEVFALRRNVSAVAGGLEPIACDLAVAGSVDEKVPEALDNVVFAVGADAHSPEAYERAYVRALDNLLTALARRRRPPRRFVLVSSTAVYAQDGGEWVDETSPTEPQEFSGRTLLRSEALVRSAPGESVVVRFGGIYGPGRTRFVDGVRSGTLRLGAGAEYTNRIHRDDCAEVLRHLLWRDRCAPLYVGVDDEPADRREVARWIARKLGVATAEATATDAMPHGKRCSNRRLRTSGYAFRYPTFREGYGELILAMPKDGV